MDTHMHTCTHARTHMYTHAHTHIEHKHTGHGHGHTHTHMCTHTHTHAHTHTHTHTHTHHESQRRLSHLANFLHGFLQYILEKHAMLKTKTAHLIHEAEWGDDLQFIQLLADY